MVYTQENIDPVAMTAQDLRSIAGDTALVQAYALNTVAEATAAVNQARAPSEDPDERAWRVYDKLEEVLWDRLQDTALMRTVMKQAGEFGAMHERYEQLAADKDVRKMLDSIGMRHDVPRAHLIQLKGGAVFSNADDGITYSAIGQAPIKFKTDADFKKWVAAEHVSPEQSDKALSVIHATRRLANMTTTEQTKPEVKHIGSMMPRPEWAKARDEVSNPGQTNGRVLLPKAANEYAGRIVFMTDTHLVQQVGKNIAFVHDLSKLDNGQDLASSFDAKKIGPRTNVVVRYGEERGIAEVVPFNVQMAKEVQKNAIAWAEQKIPNDRTRAAFVKHLDAFTQDLSKGFSPQPAKPAITPRAPERTQQIERPR